MLKIAVCEKDMHCMKHLIILCSIDISSLLCFNAAASARYSREDCIVEISIDMHNQNEKNWIDLQEKILKIFAGTKGDTNFNLASGLVVSRTLIHGHGYVYIQYMDKCENRIKLTHYLFDQHFSKEIPSFPKYIIDLKHVKPGSNTINISGPYWRDSD
jgi:hypothetical protein